MNKIAGKPLIALKKHVVHLKKVKLKLLLSADWLPIAKPLSPADNGQSMLILSLVEKVARNSMLRSFLRAINAYLW